VLGAASMGALRAAELHPYGMIGVGTIFEWYRDGTIDGDDEVAVWHGCEEDGFRPLSEPLVNIRATLQRAVADGYLDAEEAQALTDCAKQLHYPERSYRRLLWAPLLKGCSEHDRAKLALYFATQAVDQKKLDVLAVLRYCFGMGRTGPLLPPAEAPAPSELWQRMRVFLGGFPSSQGVVTGETVLEKAGQDLDLLAAMWSSLSGRYFLLEWARQQGVSLPEGILDAFIDRWERDRGIDRTEQWLRANGLTAVRYRRLLAEQALADWLTQQGPNHFGLTWDFTRALWEEGLIWGREDSTAAPHLRVEWSSRRFLLEWAGQNGVSCPPDLLDHTVEQWEQTNPAVDRSEWLRRHGLTAASFRTLVAERTLAEWITAQGPDYFGHFWYFEEVLLNELQVTGLAARLLERERG
jgi:hypothetical protein